MVKPAQLNQYKFYLITALAVISTFILIQLLIATSGIQKQISAKNYELATLQAKLTAMNRLLGELEAYRDKTKVITDSLPEANSYGEFSYFVQEIERIAKQSGNTIALQIDKDAKLEKSNLASIGFTMESKSSYLGYADMLDLMSKLPYHTKLDSLKIDNQTNNMTALIKFKLFAWQESGL